MEKVNITRYGKSFAHPTEKGIAHVCAVTVDYHDEQFLLQMVRDDDGKRYNIMLSELATEVISDLMIKSLCHKRLTEHKRKIEAARNGIKVRMAIRALLNQ